MFAFSDVVNAISDAARDFGLNFPVHTERGDLFTIRALVLEALKAACEQCKSPDETAEHLIELHTANEQHTLTSAQVAQLPQAVAAVTSAYSTGYKEAMRQALLFFQHPRSRALLQEFVAEFWWCEDFRRAFREARLSESDFELPNVRAVAPTPNGYPTPPRVPPDSYENGRARAFAETLELLDSIGDRDAIQAMIDAFKGSYTAFVLAFEWAGLDPAEFEWEESALDETAEWDIPPEWLEEEPFNTEIEDEE